MPTQQEEGMINQIIKDWIGEVDVPYFEPEDPLERGRIQGRNNHIVLLQSRIPQLTERIEKEVLTQIQLDLDNGKFHSICSNETTFTKYIINTLKGGKEN